MFLKRVEMMISTENVKFHKADVDFMKIRESYGNATHFTPQAH